MTILSYRGPGSPGGVSGAISRIFDMQSIAGERWWHLSESCLTVRQCQSTRQFCVLPSEIVEGHYRYCNNFLWPIFHDMPEYASFSPGDRALYLQFNLAFGVNVLHAERHCSPAQYFVQDYQLVLAAPILSGDFPDRTSVFWHIPWPKSIKQEHVPMVSEIAAALLSVSQVGFHIEEYANNFLRFVEAHLPDCHVDLEDQTISSTQRIDSVVAQRTEIIVQPLGLDLQFWKEQSMREEQAPNFAVEEIPREYILSVDRADYTKGVLERLAAINVFFEMYPDWKEKLTFVQVCQRTREGLSAYDDYWNKCVTLAAEVNSRLGRTAWKPVLWISEPVSPAVLALLYRQARGMLVNPLRDGLNLTAKEFIACAGEKSGTLLLSDGAGVWHEFGQHALRVKPENSEEMAASILEGLLIPLAERAERTKRLKSILRANSLTRWWQRFAGDPMLTEPLVTHQLARAVG